MSSTNRARRLHVLRNVTGSRPAPLTVLKIGGSLFDLPELPDVVGRVVAQRPGNAALLVAGGGPAADVVREWDRVYHLGEDAAHELALEGLDLTASLLARFFPTARLVRSEQQMHMAIADRALSILCAGCFIKAAVAQGHPPLEHSWRVTSDSIAAWTARVLRASELVLLKSIPVPCALSLSAAAAAGVVDEHFPVAAASLSAIGWVNARAGESEIDVWQTRDKDLAAKERE
jgi:5-(aminomethyl)-3-furanmethanol phosphate kinase